MDDTPHFLLLLTALLVISGAVPPHVVPHPGTIGIPYDCAWLEGTVTHKIVESGDPHDRFGIAFSGSIDNVTQRYGYITVSETTYNAAELNESYEIYTCEMFKIHDMIEDGTWVFIDL